MLRRELLGLWLIGLACPGCGRGTDRLTLFYQNEVVEAPARTTDVAIYEGVTCDQVLSALHEDFAASHAALKRAAGPYPLGEKAGQLLAEVKTGATLAIDAVTYDHEGLQAGRGCGPVTLDPAQSQEIRLELRMLPACESSRTKLDLMLVVDTSVSMEFADPDRVHLQGILDTVLDPMAALPNMRFGLVTFGNGTGAAELVPMTSDIQLVRTAIHDLENVSEGAPRLFDGLFKATSLIRARAICDFQPAVLALASSADSMSSRAFEDAQLGVFATPGDQTDDLFLFGIGFSEGGFRDLNDLVPEGERGVITGAGSAAQITAALREARNTIFALVQ